MVIYRCKMCGGDLEVETGDSSCICEFCGTQQTLPKVMDENLQGMFNRANILRMKAEFDRASEIYEKILQVSNTESEAYWGLILCKYGIEYVEDPTTFQRIPTCHRASYDVVTADEDFKLAVQYADVIQRGIYEEQAEQIDKIQKGIVDLAQKETSYDVFICYKETDNTGNRTQDSMLANEIYYQLMEEGFKVFYAAISLEDKIGEEYEPYIFSALNSSKVMLSLGTKPEYFNAPWVKNEWSRFLKIMKKDRSRILIPCYRDMDAYELPEEFAHLQAQDMSKIGFINDVVRGIKKIINKEESDSNSVNEMISSQSAVSGTNVDALIKRGYMALEDAEWEKADQFFEEALNSDAEIAEAYFGKLLAENHCENSDQLVSLLGRKYEKATSLEYVLACQTEEEHINEISNKYYIPNYLKKEMIKKKYNYDLNFHSELKERKKQKEQQMQELEDNKLLARARKYSSGEFQLFLEGIVDQIIGFLDQRIKLAEEADAQNVEKIKGDYQEYIKVTDNEIERLYNAAAEKRESNYQEYKERLKKLENDSSAIEMDFITLKNDYIMNLQGYKDSISLEQRCVAGSEKARIRELEREKEEAVKLKKRKIKINLGIIAVCIVIAITLMIFVIIPTLSPLYQYSRGIKQMEAGKYLSAMHAFKKVSSNGYSHERKVRAEKKRIEAFKALKRKYKEDADNYLVKGDNIKAAIYYMKAGEIAAAKGAYDFTTKVAAGWNSSLAIANDGTVQYAGGGERVLPVDTLSGINAISYFGKEENGGFVGLTADGKVVTQNPSSLPSFYSKEVKKWTELKQFVGNDVMGFGLNRNGNVVLATNVGSFPSGLDQWKNIVEIGGAYTENQWKLWGIDSSGYLHSTGIEGVASFSDCSIKKFETDNVDLKQMVVLNQAGEIFRSIPSDYIIRNKIGRKRVITDILLKNNCLVGLTDEGKIEEEFYFPSVYEEDFSSYQQDIEDGFEDWRDVVSIQDAPGGVVGITIEGKVLYQSLVCRIVDAADDSDDKWYLLKGNNEIETAFKAWSDIIYLVSATDSQSEEALNSDEDTEWFHALGVKSDGSIVSLTDGDYAEVSGWKLW